MTDRAAQRIGGAHSDALIEATVAEFATAGWEGASLNRIIRAAGISKSSFYHAVSSKAELFDAVVDALVADVRERWSPPDPPEFAGDVFWPSTDQLLRDLGRLSAEDPALTLLGRIFYLPVGAEPDARTALLRAVSAWVGAVLAIGVASGAVRDDIPLEALAAAVFGMLRGLDEWALSGETVTDADAAARTPALLLRGMLAPAGS